MKQRKRPQALAAKLHPKARDSPGRGEGIKDLLALSPLSGPCGGRERLAWGRGGKRTIHPYRNLSELNLYFKGSSLNCLSAKARMGINWHYFMLCEMAASQCLSS